MEREVEHEVEHKVNGEMKTEIQYYHRIVVVILVSTSFPIPLGVRLRRTAKARSPVPWLCCKTWSGSRSFPE
jgi:hypothetical protein